MPTSNARRFSIESLCHKDDSIRSALITILVASMNLGCFAADTRNPAIAPIDPDAMRDTVQRLAREMLVPGAVVILHTPNGDFKTTYGVNTYRGKTPTSFDQHVR